jgi:hypothetical protein
METVPSNFGYNKGAGGAAVYLMILNISSQLKPIYQIAHVRKNQQQQSLD